MTGGAVAGQRDDARTRAAVLEAVRRSPVLRTAGGVTDLVRMDGMSNATYRVTVAGRGVVVRVPTPGDDPVIDRATEAHNCHVAAAFGLAPRVVSVEPAHEVLITDFVDGAALTADAAHDHATLRRVARLLRRMHDLDPRSFRGRCAPFAAIDRYRAELADTDVALGPFDDLIARVQPVRDALAATSPGLVPCHHDPWPTNIVDDGDRLLLVDWEYSGVGDPLWDLTHFAVEADLDDDSMQVLLASWYHGTPPRSIVARVALWRPVAHLRWSLWATVMRVGGSPVAELEGYADRRRRQAARLLDEARTVEALRHLSS
ncbi:MAG: phosphotransferase family protein [Actinobacteria bacterium]|nr:phosphotransferase family protein [Actinomycetota bacterium]